MDNNVTKETQNQPSIIEFDCDTFFKNTAKPSKVVPIEKMKRTDAGQTNQPVKEQPVKNQPVKEQPVRNQPVKEQPVKNEPAKNQPPPKKKDG